MFYDCYIFKSIFIYINVYIFRMKHNGINYITDLKSIEYIVESSSKVENHISLKKVERIVLIGELYLNSIKMLKQDKIKIEYADPTKLDFSYDNGSVHIYSGEKGMPDISLNKSDAKSTIILMRSGYTKEVVSSLLDSIQELGILILNNKDSVAMSSDKYSTACFLAKSNLPQPKYVLATSADIDKEDHKKLDEKLKKLYGNLDDSHKYVCKILNGHGGKGVFCCRGKNIVSILQCLFKLKANSPILIQDFQEIKDGDIRVHVLTLNGKQKILSSIMRKKGKDFRTNLSLGCEMEDDYKLTSEQERLALNAAKASGLEWCGVDMLPLQNGKTIVVELNGAPGPSSPINDPNIEETNFKFFEKLVEAINELCK